MSGKLSEEDYKIWKEMTEGYMNNEDRKARKIALKLIDSKTLPEDKMRDVRHILEITKHLKEI